MKPHKVLKKHKSKINRELLLFSLPPLLFLFAFSYLPLPGLIIAFKNIDFRLGIFGSPWVGLQNFRFLVFSGIAVRITRNTMLWNIVFIILTNTFGLFVALIINELSRKAVKVYQTVLFLPHFISWVVAAYFGIALFSFRTGVLNQLLAFIGQDPVMWYTEPKQWLAILPLAHLWKHIGYSTLIYYTGLISIDTGLYEAAEIEGAGRLRQIIHISVPLIAPLVVLLVILAVGNIFRGDFGLFFQFTRNSAPLYEVTDVMDTYVYRALLQTGDTGMAAAACFYQSIVGFVVVLLTNAMARKFNPDFGLF